MFKVDTVAQFKCLKFLEKNFEIKMLDIKICDASSLWIEDVSGDKAIVTFDENNRKIELYGYISEIENV